MIKLLFFLIVIQFVSSLFGQSKNIDENANSDFRINDSTGTMEVFISDTVKIEMIKVLGGAFKMGYEKGYRNERPVHEVSLNDYYIGKIEVTQKLWKAVLKENPAHFNDCLECPVEMISYFDALEFIEQLNQITGLEFRLPTEAEWEYAAYGGQQGKRYRYSGGNKLQEVAWYKRNSENKTHPVGLLRSNEIGVFDLSGNVYEWTQDWAGRYKRRDQHNPKGPKRGREKIIRGGCWYDSRDACRIHCRVEIEPDDKNGCLGLRLAHDIKVLQLSGN